LDDLRPAALLFPRTVIQKARARELTPRELELLQGMRNCYSVCHANYEGTVEMVGGTRGLEPEEVKQMLSHIKENSANEKEYKELRAQLPKEFPF
jgi:hypothetical protein